MPIPSVPSVVSGDKAYRVTTEEVEVTWTVCGTTYKTVIEEGFRYRPGVSVRLGSLGLIDLFGPSYALEDASAAHDWVYHVHEVCPSRAPSRRVADALLLEDEGDPYGIRLVAWAVTRAVGWIVW
jgi:hypothetical protein